MTDHHERLELLRNWMQKQNVQAYVLPMNDEWMNEYVPASEQRLPWLTGFDGSAGTAVITLNEAVLFVDGRYTLQAVEQVSANDYRILNVGDEQPEVWLANNLSTNATVELDSRLFTRSSVSRYRAQCEKRGCELRLSDTNPIDAIWQDRPAAPASQAIIHPIEYAGQTSAEKRQSIADTVHTAGADALLLTAPDSIIWLLNIRGTDVQHTPLLLCRALLDTDGKVILFLAEERISTEVRNWLGDDVIVQKPDSLEDTLKELGKKKQKIMLDPAQTTQWFFSVLEKVGTPLVETVDPCQLPKACKNEVEVAGMRAAHHRDAIAVIRFLAWLDGQIKAQEPITELDAANKLEALRRAHSDCRDLSFDTISGFGPNGAIVHYRVNESSNRELISGNLYLVDSGGQYPDGTTDITRTVAIGTPTPEHRACYTRVLKGHVALARACFPKGTTGSQLDVLARAPLWNAGQDFDHGTGHGVGSYLSVHEGPQRIGKRGGDVALQPGMILSNEPGYYREGEFGIRIENLVVVVPSEIGEEGRSFMEFDTLTRVPFDRRLIDIAQLSAEEIAWIDAYHKWLRDDVLDDLPFDVQAWLTAQTAPLKAELF